VLSTRQGREGHDAGHVPCHGLPSPLPGPAGAQHVAAAGVVDDATPAFSKATRTARVPEGRGPQKTAAAPERARVARQLEADLREKSGVENGGSRKARRLEKRHRGPKMGAAGRPPFSATRRGGAWLFAKAGPEKMAPADVGVRNRTLCFAASHFPRHAAAEAPETRPDRRMWLGTSRGQRPTVRSGRFLAGLHARAAAHALHSRRAPPPADVPTFSRAGGTRPRARAARCNGNAAARRCFFCQSGCAVMRRAVATRLAPTWHGRCTRAVPQLGFTLCGLW